MAETENSLEMVEAKVENLSTREKQRNLIKKYKFNKKLH